MLMTLEVVTVFLVALAMTMALAHALEYPGKLRLDEQTYMAVQAIYYPGFTLGGIGEVMAVVATFVLAMMMRDRGDIFWWVLTAFVAVVAMQVVFWLVTQPVNRFWLRKQHLGNTSAKFFGVKPESDSEGFAQPDWKGLRKRWEYSHMARACLSVIALIATAIAIAR